ncbi:hypothetical protein TrVFT333_001074 [Trichoderma virens FT-333]|nr:hypothetical protein TrVFT333_001074 [Trichoderma virens FT-333]
MAFPIKEIQNSSPEAVDSTREAVAVMLHVDLSKRQSVSISQSELAMPPQQAQLQTLREPQSNSDLPESSFPIRSRVLSRLDCRLFGAPPMKARHGGLPGSGRQRTPRNAEEEAPPTNGQMKHRLYCGNMTYKCQTHGGDFSKRNKSTGHA